MFCYGPTLCHYLKLMKTYKQEKQQFLVLKGKEGQELPSMLEGITVTILYEWEREKYN